MVPLIPLAALIGPQDPKPAVHPARNIQPTDLPELSHLYQNAYGNATPAPDKTADRISAVFEGSRGTPLPKACLLTTDTEGRITAAILTTERDLGTDGPGTAFIAELFTHPDHRRQGLAEQLLSHALQALHDTGHRTVAVTVDSANAGAIALYLARDFRRLTPLTEDH